MFVYPSNPKKYRGRLVGKKVYIDKDVFIFKTIEEARASFLETNRKNGWIKNLIRVVPSIQAVEKYLEVDIGNGKVMLADFGDIDLIQSLSIWNNGYYALAKVNKKNVLYHVLIFEEYIPEGYTIDHINRNSFDNRRANLRLVSKKTQAFNRNIPKHNKSGVVGVFFVNKSGREYWVAKWFVNGKQEQKYFDASKPGARELAIEYRKKKEKEYFIP